VERQTRRAVLGTMGAALSGWAAIGRGAPVAPVAPVDLLGLPAPATARGARRRLLDVVSVGSRLVAVGDFGLILASDDGGAHWQQQQSPIAVMLTATWFNDSLHGWAVGHDGIILATEDGGRRWRRQLDGQSINQQMLQAATAQLEKARAEPPGKVPQELLDNLEDRLADAEAAVQAGPSRPLLGLRFVDARTGFVVGSYGQLLHTTDAGQTWNYIGDRLNNDTGLHLNRITLAPSGALYIAAEGGTVFRSDDQGQHWTRIRVGYNGQLYGLVALNDGLLAYGFNGRLFRSDAQGQRWATLPAPTGKSLVQGTRLPDGRLLLASQSGELLLGDARAETFRRQASGNAELSGMTVMPGSSHVVTVGGLGARVTALNLSAT